MDFGGKTGTTKNNSDAWYMGVTPKLVAGAWVGGEYRSIHFRTGALGQGSRTALPIFGNFISTLLRDPRFAHYMAKFPEPKEEIDPKDYEGWGGGGGYVRTFSVDSLRKLGPMEGVGLGGNGGGASTGGATEAANTSEGASAQPTPKPEVTE